jgi:cobalt-zinc-cadmium efflux system membrane fusion protein
LSTCKTARQNQEDNHDPANDTKTTAYTMSDEKNHQDHDHGNQDDQGDQDQEDPKAHPIDPRDQAEFGIELATAQSGSIQKNLNLIGEVRVNENTVSHVSPRFSGMVKRIHKRLGDTIKAGEVLAEMESNESLRPFELTATLDGTITDFHITPGESFEAGERLYTIADTATVWVDLRLYQRDLPRARIGQSVTLDFGDNFPAIEARISYLGPVVDETSRTGLIRAVVPNKAGLLRPGLFVLGDLQLDRETFPVVVSRVSVITMEDHEVVFVPTPDGFKPRTVTTGSEDADHIAILDGLQPGESYVSKGSFYLKADA